MHKYWVVGAMWGGKEDALPMFIERGYWYCWDANDFSNKKLTVGNSIKVQQDRFRSVSQGDRIAVKRLLGQGSSDMSILAIGVVKAVDTVEWRIYVNWVLPEIKDRKVPLKGCTASIHGPFQNDDPWVQQVFCL